MTAASSATIRVGRTLRLGALAGVHVPVSAMVTVVYGTSAPWLVGKTSARGLVQLGSGRTRIALVLRRVRVVAASDRAAMMVGGAVLSSGRASCTKGTPVTVQLVDDDALTARPTADASALPARAATRAHAST